MLELEGHTLLNYSCNLSGFRCWNCCIKVQSASKDLSLEMLSMNRWAYFVWSRYLFLTLESRLILLFPICLKRPEQGIFLPYA